MALLMFASTGARAGGGQVRSDGSVELNLNFTYPPTEEEINRVIVEMQVASRMICDASDGVLRIGQLNITAGEGQPSKHDMIVNFQADGRSRSDLVGLGRDGNGTSRADRKSVHG